MAKQTFNKDRRHFFKTSLISVAAAALAPYFRGSSSIAFAGATLPLLKESDPTATALGYNANADKVDVKKWTKKAGPDGKSQNCSGCMFYTGIDKKVGKCQIFPNNTVSANAWCNSWSKKA